MGKEFILSRTVINMKGNIRLDCDMEGDVTFTNPIFMKVNLKMGSLAGEENIFMEMEIPL